VGGRSLDRLVARLSAGFRSSTATSTAGTLSTSWSPVPTDGLDRLMTLLVAIGRPQGQRDGLGFGYARHDAYQSPIQSRHRGAPKRGSGRPRGSCLPRRPGTTV
jgi:hypothetical protein